MKILHINTERHWRGGERQTVFLLDGLRDRSIEADLVCQPGSPLAGRALASKNCVWPVSMRGEADFLAVRILRRLVKVNGYDLIHSHTSHAHTLAYWATVGRCAARLVTRRVEYSIYRNSFFRLNQIKYRFMADAYIAISKRVKQVLISDNIPNKMIFVVPSGVPLDTPAVDDSYLRAEFNIGPQTPVLLSMAHLSPEKGHGILLKALAEAARQIPDIRLLIVGDGECRQDLEALVGTLGIKQQVVFTGFRDDIGAFYRIADGFVSSSTAEGLGSAALDALAFAVPVVATAVGGIPEFIEHGRTGILVPPADPSALAKAIIDLVSQPRRAADMAASGREEVRRRFSVDQMVDGTVDVYQRLLPGGRVKR